MSSHQMMYQRGHPQQLRTGRLIGVTVEICAATLLGSQNSNQDLAAHIIQDTALLEELGWHQSVA